MAQPNILFIVSDQHAQRALGCYGDTVGATPRLDALARDGVVFDNAYCPSPICGPSRMSMMTGREPHQNRCWLNTDILNSGTPTYAHALGAAGYRTALIGRMHFIGPDQTHGFAERLVGDHSANWPGNPTFDHGALRGTAGPDRASIDKSGAGVNAYDWKDRDTAAAAVDWLRREGKVRAREPASPFHLTIGFMLPHPPYVADPEDFAAMQDKVPPPAIARPAAEREHPRTRRWRTERGIDDVDAGAVSRARQAYWGMVRRLDGLIGDVLDALEAAGLAEDTLVIYASDHGDHLGDRGLFWKHTFFDESAKIPLIMRWPNRLPAGGRRDGIAGLIDLGATMADAAGAAWTGGGDSLLPLAADPGVPWRDEITCEYCTTGTAYGQSSSQRSIHRMVRRGRYKLCYYHGLPPQMFDMVSDPFEQEDLAASEPHAAVRKALLDRVLSDWDPDEIAGQLVARERDAALLARWAQRTGPDETHRWSMPDGKSPTLMPTRT